jgi:hypothetical protein
LAAGTVLTGKRDRIKAPYSSASTLLAALEIIDDDVH